MDPVLSNWKEPSSVDPKENAKELCSLASISCFLVLLSTAGRAAINPIYQFSSSVVLCNGDAILKCPFGKEFACILEEGRLWLYLWSVVSVGMSRASNLAPDHCRRAWRTGENQISVFRCVSLVAEATKWASGEWLVLWGKKFCRNNVYKMSSQPSSCVSASFCLASVHVHSCSLCRLWRPTWLPRTATGSLWMR